LFPRLAWGIDSSLVFFTLSRSRINFYTFKMLFIGTEYK
jgi:hypothetical protein